MAKKQFFQIGRRLARNLSYILGGISLCACSIQKERANLTQPLDLNPSIREAFLSNDFVPSSWMSEKWWEMFGDAQLNLFVETALEKNPTIHSAIEAVASAHDSAKQSFAPLLPSVTADFQEALAAFNWRKEGLVHQEPVLPTSFLPNWINVLGYFLNFKWNLDIWGKQAKLHKAAIDQMRGEIASAAFKKLLLSVQVANSYITLQYYLRMLDLQNQLIQAQKDSLLIQQEMSASALADNFDLILAEKVVLNSNIQVLTTLEGIAKSQHQLKIYMGLSPDDPDPIQSPKAQFDFPFPFPSNVSIDLLSKRPDVVAKIWTIQAAMKRVNSAKVAFFPSINLASISGFFNLTYKELLEPKAWFTSVLPGASLPLFQGLGLRANLKYSLRQFNLAVYDYNSLLLNAAQDVVDSITSFRIVNQKLEQQTEILQRSQEYLELSGMRFEYGLSTYLEVLSSEVTWLNDQIEYEQLIETRLLAILNLIKSVGGGYNNSDAQVDMEKDFIYE